MQGQEAITEHNHIQAETDNASVQTMTNCSWRCAGILWIQHHSQVSYLHT